MGILNTTDKSFGLSLNQLGRLKFELGLWDKRIYIYSRGDCIDRVLRTLNEVPVEQLTLDLAVDAIKSIVRANLHNIVLAPTLSHKITLSGGHHFTIIIHRWNGSEIRDDWRITFAPHLDNNSYIFDEFLRMSRIEANKYGMDACPETYKYGGSVGEPLTSEYINFTTSPHSY